MKIIKLNPFYILSKWIDSLLIRFSLLFLLEKQLNNNCYSVIDVGCGRSSLLQHIKKPFYKIGIDFYKPYLTESKLKSIHNDYILGDVRNLPFNSKSFDYAVASEVIEHLNKTDGLRMIKEMERVAKDKIVLTAPNGFLWALPGPEDNPEEKHISGWTVSELRRLRFKVYGFNGLNVLYRKRDSIGLLFILQTITHPLVYYYPITAFHLFFFKDINDVNSRDDVIQKT